LVNIDELEYVLLKAERRVLEIQAKLHRWASDDPHRRFDDLYNLVTDPGFLLVAWDRVRSNKGARTAGVDGETAYYIESVRGLEGFLAELREDLKSRTFRPLPARRRAIPKAGGKVRYLGIATIRDRVAQASLKLVLEPIFEADCAPRGAALPDAVRDRVGLLSQQGSGSWGQPDPGGAGEGGSSPDNVAGARYYQTRRPR
jgi:RNA-directed DNA polymerase